MSFQNQYQQNMQNVGRPPFIRFERRAEEDRAESIANNRRVFKDVDWVIVKSPGSKDETEHLVIDWLNHNDRLTQLEPPQIPEGWAVGWRKMYEDWKNGQEPSPMGFPVRNWPAISKAVAENLCVLGITTVEDVADMNESALKAVGMGSRQLKEQARAWLDQGKEGVALEVVALRAQVADQQAQNANMLQKIAALEAALAGQAARVNDNALQASITANRKDGAQ